MDEKDKRELISHSTDIALSSVSSLVGFAMGGPVGAVVGGVISPTTKLAIKAGELWFQRHQKRLIAIVQNAFDWSGKKEEVILQEIMDSSNWCDDIMSMIQQLIDSDPELDMLFSKIMAIAIGASDESERNRMIVLNNSIKGMNKVQVLILKYIYLEGGILSAHDMAQRVCVPEWELRNAVRDLELRGMLVDNGEEPTIWKLRELGIVVAKNIKDVDVMEVE